MDSGVILLQCEYFKGLSARNRKALAPLCVPREFGKRETLFLEDTKGPAVYVLATGGVQLLKTTEDGREIVIKTVKPGEVFAEVILFESDTYPVTAVAVQKSVVLEIGLEGFHELLAETGFRNDFIGTLMERLRYLADRIVSLTSCDVEERFFLFLEAQYGQADEIVLTLSNKAIAAAIGTTPETLSRLKLRLVEEGKIEWRGRRVRRRGG